MNNIDSDSVQVMDASPINPFAVPETAGQKAATLKARFAKILSASGVKTADAEDGPTHFTFGVGRIDTALRGNAAADGLPKAALHEIHAAEKTDMTSAAAMALLLAERCREGKPILWITEAEEAHRQGRLYPPGIAELGIDPDTIIHIDAPDNITALRAAADGVRSSAMGTVIVELAGKRPKGLDLTATRRLSLSAQKSGVLNLLLRRDSDTQDPLPTAAFSRWEISAAPSIPLEANAPGHSTFDITLLRHRSGLYGLSARLEWNRDDRIFRDRQAGEAAPDLGTVPALSADRADHQGARAA
ncbi:MAG: hypothetical protein ABJN65_14960 [Parasphingorhabdus sp.]